MVFGIMTSLVILTLVGVSHGFYVDSVEPEVITVKLGEPFSVLCTASSWYEWCTFTHDGNSCEYQWKKTPYNVTDGPCDDFQDRAEFVGDYNYYQCGITITKAEPGDAGEWSCDIVSYVNGNGGSRGDGYTASKTYTVIVDMPPTTTTTTSTTTTTTTTSTITTEATNSDFTLATSTEGAEEDTKEFDEDVLNDDTASDESAYKDEEENISDDEENNTVFVVVAVCLILAVAGLSVLLSLHFKGKLQPIFDRLFGKRWKPVKTDLDLEEDDADTDGNEVNGVKDEKKILKGEDDSTGVETAVVKYVTENEEAEAKLVL